ncbi:Uncharacterized protein APZ42_024608 [Daphnia magna]|uniref:Uncharacterized protein n=1 Tax=Daphnia magna TaxID=35525 RepID=A0A164TWG3_9CRUS|nr:Uncharacterized protein APZ42_024608 [Daphnia magna]
MMTKTTSLLKPFDFANDFIFSLHHIDFIEKSPGEIECLFGKSRTLSPRAD